MGHLCVQYYEEKEYHLRVHPTNRRFESLQNEGMGL